MFHIVGLSARARKRWRETGIIRRLSFAVGGAGFIHA